MTGILNPEVILLVSGSTDFWRELSVQPPEFTGCAALHREGMALYGRRDIRQQPLAPKHSVFLLSRPVQSVGPLIIEPTLDPSDQLEELLPWQTFDSRFDFFNCTHDVMIAQESAVRQVFCCSNGASPPRCIPSAVVLEALVRQFPIGTTLSSY